MRYILWVAELLTACVVIEDGRQDSRYLEYFIPNEKLSVNGRN